MSDSDRDGTKAHGLAALMSEYAWAMHDFQGMAHTLSLLVSSLTADEGLDGSSFAADIDAVTNRLPASAVAKRVAAAMTEEDRQVLRTLTKTRETLVRQFFIAYRLDPGAADVPDGALEAVKAARAEIAAGQAVLDRLGAALSQEKTQENAP